MIELGSGEQTVVRRLRLGAGGLDPLAATLRARSAFAAVSVGAAGLSPRAVLCVRTLADPRPRSCSFDPATLRVPQVWRERLGDELARLARAAVRPAREAVPAAAESVLFSDRSELLAALGADWSRGRAGERWWWRSLLGRAPDAQAVAAAWERWAEYAPAALELLSRTRGAAAAFALSLPAGGAESVLRRVVGEHALVDLARALAPPSGEARSADVDAARAAAGVSVESVADDRAPALPPWHEYAPEGAEAGPDASRQTLVGVSLMIVRAPAVVRRAEFARRALLWARRPASGDTPPDAARARTHAAREDSAERSSATSDAPSNASPSVRESESRWTHDEAAQAVESAKPGRDGRERAAGATEPREESLAARRASPRAADESRAGEPRSRVSDEGVEQGAIMRAGSTQSGEEEVVGESSEAAASAAARAEIVSPPLLEAEIETRFGGMFHLVNLGQYLGLYGDFTQPAAPGIALPLWDFVAALGRRLAGPRVERDAVWPLLARLAGRGEGDEPGATFEPPDEWRVPADWLKPFAREGGGAWRWSASRGRLRLLHPRGFFVIDAPLEALEPNVGQQLARARRQLARGIEPFSGFVSAADLALAPRGLSVPWRTARARWLGHVAAYARARLRLALGVAARSRIARRLVERPARVCVTATHVDVLMRLADLPVEVRSAGLDRDPGWVPAAGRYVAFHFD